MNHDYSIKVGDIVRFSKGKYGRTVSFALTGKVIICKNKIPVGYAEIKSVEVRDNCYLVTAEHIIHDLYSNIPYDEFKETVEKNDYKIGFDREFNGENDNVEHQVFAYNTKYKTCIISETYTTDRGVGMLHMDIYMPHAKVEDFATKNTMFERGSSNGMVILNAGKASSLRPLLFVREYMNNIVVPKLNGVIKWPSDERPHLALSADRPKSADDYKEMFYSRMSLLDNEALEIFEGCDFLPELIKYKKGESI